MNTLFITTTILSWLLGSLISVSAQAGKLDTYGGFTDVKGEQTGFFHTQNIDGRWWLVTPEGHGFFGIGLSHPVTSFSEGAVTFSYNGNQEAWLRDGIRKMRDLGYNCVWSGPYSTERVRLGFVDLELAERVYREEKIPHAIHVPLIKHNVELKPECPIGSVVNCQFIQSSRPFASPFPLPRVLAANSAQPRPDRVQVNVVDKVLPMRCPCSTRSDLKRLWNRCPCSYLYLLKRIAKVACSQRMPSSRAIQR